MEEMNRIKGECEGLCVVVVPPLFPWGRSTNRGTVQSWRRRPSVSVLVRSCRQSHVMDSRIPSCCGSSHRIQRAQYNRMWFLGWPKIGFGSKKSVVNASQVFSWLVVAQ